MQAPGIVKGTLGNAPAIVRMPARISAPPIILWHGFGAPSSEAALMDALPLDEVPAIKVYLGLPLFGTRSPSPPQMSLPERQAHDYGLLLFEPAVLGAADELPAVIADLQKAGCLRSTERVSLFGFSASGAAVLYAISQHKISVAAAVIVNGITGLKDGIQALEHATSHAYDWSPRSRELAEETDYAARPRAIARAVPYPALLLIQGTSDEVVSSTNVQVLYDALVPWYSKAGEAHRLQLSSAVDLHHGWATGESNALVRRLTASWFNEFDSGPRQHAQQLERRGRLSAADRIPPRGS